MLTITDHEWSASIVHGEHVNVQRDVADTQRRNRHLGLYQKLNHRRIYQRQKGFRMFVQALVQTHRRGNLTNTQGFLEKAIRANILHRFKVAFAKTQQPQIRFDDVTMGIPCRRGIIARRVVIKVVKRLMRNPTSAKPECEV